MAKSRKERRRHPRAKGAADLLLGVDSRTPGAPVKDLSLSGVNFIVDEPIEFMTRLMMTVVFPTRDASKGKSSAPADIQFEGAVVRCEPVKSGDDEKYEVAASFTHMDEAARSAIEEYVQTH
jgi:hypothetical protein